MIAEATLEDRIHAALTSGQVVFLKITSPTGYAFLCWVYSDPAPFSSRVQTLYTEYGSAFSLTNTYSWPNFEQYARWISTRDATWLEPEQMTALLQSPLSP